MILDILDKAMRISTRGRYGLRAMFELARSFGGAPVLMSAVAERQDLSRKYLHALLTTLKSAGLVRSVRGAGGGFLLARPPAEIRISEGGGEKSTNGKSGQWFGWSSERSSMRS